MVRVPERRAHYAICDVSPCYTTRLSPLDLEKSSPSNNVLLHRRDRDISFEQHREKFRICTDQRLFNVKETHYVTVRREGRRIGTRILEGRGYREQLDGSTDVNGEGERERERDTMARRDLCTRAHCRIYYRNRCVPLWSVTEEACTGGRVADALNQLAASRENPAREPPSGRRARRSFSVCRREPPASACIYLPLWKRTTTTCTPSNRGDCTRK